MKRYCLLALFLFTAQIFAQNIDSVKVGVLAKSTKSWDGNTLPSYSEGQPEITILRVTVPPKQILKWHKHPVINAGIMLSGNLTVITETNDTLNLKAGDTLIEVVGKFHFGINNGDIPAEIVVFYAGTEGASLSVKKVK